MARRRIPRRVAATAVALFGLFVSAPPSAAVAGSTGTAGNATSRTVSSGTFAVVPTLLTTGVPVPAPAALTFSTLAPRAFYEAVNTGTIDLVAASYGLNLVYVGTGTPTITLASCPGSPWNQGLNSCPVTPVTIGSWGAVSATMTASTQVPTTRGAACTCGPP